MSHYPICCCCCCCCPVAQSCLTLFDPVDCSMPGSPVLHHLPELAQTHVHRVSDVIQPSHPLCSLLLLPSVFPSIRIFSNFPALQVRKIRLIEAMGHSTGLGLLDAPHESRLPVMGTLACLCRSTSQGLRWVVFLLIMIRLGAVTDTEQNLSSEA